MVGVRVGPIDPYDYWGGVFGNASGFWPARAAIDRRDNADSTVGQVNPQPSPVKPTSVSLPSLVIPQSAAVRRILEQARWGDQVQTKGRIPVVAQNVPPPMVRRGPADTSAGPPTQRVNRGVQQVGLDLGGLLNTVVNTAGNVLTAQAGVPNYNRSYWDQYGPMGVDNSGGLQGGIPGVEVIRETPDATRGWVYKKVCGQWKWTKPKRRRRKTLLTESDYNALLRIQSLKVNSNMTIAIAKTLAR